MSEPEAYQIGQMLLRQFPRFVQMALVDDMRFSTELHLKVGSTILLEGGSVAFDRDEFLAANIAVYSGSGTKVEVLDVEGGVWHMTTDNSDGRSIVRVADGSREFLIFETPGLKPTADARLKDFEVALAAAGLPSNSMAAWREALASHVLDCDELQALSDSLDNTVGHAINRIQSALHNSVTLEALIPESPEYWERLCGIGAPADLQDLAKQVTNHASDLVRSNGLEGGKHALALAAHGALLDPSVFQPLSDSALIELLNWALGRPDVVVKLAALEAGLAFLARTAALEESLGRLVDQLLELSPDDNAGVLNLFSTLFVLVDGQLSHLRIAKDWAPLRRRHAAIAQASLIAQHWPRAFDPTVFIEWAREARGGRFYFQTLIDQHQEPRWSPDYASPGQWYNEVIGRLRNASYRHEQVVRGTRLAAKLLDAGEGSVLSRITFPGTFLPGPLEGGLAGVPELPAEFEEIIQTNLAVERLERKSLIALINMRGLFTIGGEKIARATELIQDAGHRLPPHANSNEADALLEGLASLAAITRSPVLTEELRVLTRRRRMEGPPITPHQEVTIALIAGAAYEDKQAWATTISEWLGEVAFTVDDRSAASSLLNAFDTLCIVSPSLRGGLGRLIVALESYLAI